MKCKRCGNNDPKYFYLGSKGMYCRKCVSFRRVLLKEDLIEHEYEVKPESNEYEFNYELSKYQKEASSKCLENLKKNKDVLLHCVCGAGKTEITVESISYYLSLGLKVCYAISRKEVVIELSKRFKEIFRKANVVSVYGNHHDVIDGDLIICTSHQLFRYYQCFNLLILDEVDAFPLSGNNTLMNIAIKASKGQIIYSTATTNPFIEKYLRKRPYEKVELAIRPSLKPLIVPKIIYNFDLINILIIYKLLKNKTNQVIIFCSTKKQCKYLCFIYRNIFNCTYVYSDEENRDKNIKAFKDKKYQFIFSTTVLERGVTIKDVDVIIYYDAKANFTKESLIQMCGRVGRNINNPYGEAYILSSRKRKSIDDCLKEIKEANNTYEMSIL